MFGHRDKGAWLRLLAGLGMLAGAAAYVATEVPSQSHLLVIVVAGVIGMYMAMNIGANDVANNVGAAVGSGALTMMGALAIAAVFEAAGAFIAGGDVVGTIKKGIIDPAAIDSADTFIFLMLAALFAAAIWINIATMAGAPVSTTHSIVGGVLGAGIAAAGVTVVDWGVMGKIAASWVISPVLGALIAAAFLTLIKWGIVYRDDKIAAAKTWVPILVGIMGAAFAAYLMMKGLKQVWQADVPTTVAVSVAAFAMIYFIVRPMVAQAGKTMANTREDVGRLFTIPLILSAALLCFAHGSNDGPTRSHRSPRSSTRRARAASPPRWRFPSGSCWSARSGCRSGSRFTAAGWSSGSARRSPRSTGCAPSRSPCRRR